MTPEEAVRAAYARWEAHEITYGEFERICCRQYRRRYPPVPRGFDWRLNVDGWYIQPNGSGTWQIRNQETGAVAARGLSWWEARTALQAAVMGARAEVGR